MPSNFPGSADSFDDAATIHAKKQDGTANASPPVTTYHSDLLGSFGDAIEAIENSLLTGPFSVWTDVTAADYTAHAYLGADDGLNRLQVDQYDNGTSHSLSISLFTSNADESDGVTALLYAESALDGPGWDAIVGFDSVGSASAQLLGNPTIGALLRVRAGEGQTTPLIELKDEGGTAILAAAQNGDLYLGSTANVGGFLYLNGGGANLGATLQMHNDSVNDFGALRLTAGNTAMQIVVTAQQNQTLPLLDLKDENGNDIFTVSQGGGEGVRLTHPTDAALKLVGNTTDDVQIIFDASHSAGAYDQATTRWEGPFGEIYAMMDVYIDAGTPAFSYTTLFLEAPPVGQAQEIIRVKNPSGDSWAINAEGLMELVEQPLPAAPSANRAKIYARDTGGKTELVVRFPTGAVQVLAIEP